MCKLKCIYWFSVLFLFFLFNKIGFAQGTINIVDYFLKDPGAWEHTMRIIHKNPTKVMVENSEDLVFNLTELTYGDEVALIFLNTKKAEKFKHAGICNAEDKIVPGINRIVSVTTKMQGIVHSFVTSSCSREILTMCLLQSLITVTLCLKVNTMAASRLKIFLICRVLNFVS